MKASNLLIRLTSIFICVCYSLSTNEFESKGVNWKLKSKSPLNEEDPLSREGRRFKTRSVKFQDETEVHERNRRQGGCCTAPTCNSSAPYRSMDGTCNNLNFPCAGSAGIPFIRFLSPDYETNSAPRGFGVTPPFPRPRDVSVGMTSTVNPPSLVPDAITLMLMQWGQFLDHDITFTPDDNVPSCCSGSTNASCFIIDVTGDTFYSSFNITCLEFSRSTAAQCVSGPREQFNTLTAFIDGSQVYGSSISQMDTLRVANSYLMKFGQDKENPSCAANNPSSHCRTFLPVRNSASGNEEFFAGDGRVEEQPGLTSLHTVFLRAHNHISTELKNLNPTCTDDIIFEETRKIIGALIQMITYDEFLPVVLGLNKMNAYNLFIGFFSGYVSTIDPSAPSVFATAAFRFGHSLIKNFFTLLSTTVNLAHNFNNHNRTTIAGNFPSDFMRGISSDPAEPMDHILVQAVTNFLFATPPFAHGQDLFSRNIQRGRDHGLPGYKSWINSCYPGTVFTFNDLDSLMPQQVVNKLISLYSFVEDIDLFPAAIAEHNLAGALLGPTFACINGEYFRRLKYGDRYWFENSVFTNNQLMSIYNTTLSSLLCLTTDAIEFQKYVMQPNSSSNPYTSCSTLLSKGVLNDLGTHWQNICPSG